MLRSSTALDQEAFLKIAQSITCYTGPDIAYEMGWVPPEYDAMYRDDWWVRRRKSGRSTRSA